jgi:hypothetical protein
MRKTIIDEQAAPWLMTRTSRRAPQPMMISCADHRFRKSLIGFDGPPPEVLKKLGVERSVI